MSRYKVMSGEITRGVQRLLGKPRVARGYLGMPRVAKVDGELVLL